MNLQTLRHQKDAFKTIQTVYSIVRRGLIYAHNIGAKFEQKRAEAHYYRTFYRNLTVYLMP